MNTQRKTRLPGNKSDVCVVTMNIISSKPGVCAGAIPWSRTQALPHCGLSLLQSTHTLRKDGWFSIP
ncbi:unnamed protein product, partial [Mycena citricolor]